MILPSISDGLKVNFSFILLLKPFFYRKKGFKLPKNALGADKTVGLCPHNPTSL
jgi:hypothetical protein